MDIAEEKAIIFTVTKFISFLSLRFSSQQII